MGHKALLAALVLLLSMGRSPASIKMPISAHEMQLKSFGNGNRDMIFALRGGGSKNFVFSYLRDTMRLHRKQDRRLFYAAELGQVWLRQNLPIGPFHVWFACLACSFRKRHALGMRALFSACTSIATHTFAAFHSQIQCSFFVGLLRLIEWHICMQTSLVYKHLLEGAHIEAQTSFMETALHIASMQGYVRYTRSLPEPL
jgi:hypothetical protein